MTNLIICIKNITFEFRWHLEGVLLIQNFRKITFSCTKLSEFHDPQNILSSIIPYTLFLLERHPFYTLLPTLFLHDIWKFGRILIVLSQFSGIWKDIFDNELFKIQEDFVLLSFLKKIRSITNIWHLDRLQFFQIS